IPLVQGWAIDRLIGAADDALAANDARFAIAAAFVLTLVSLLIRGLASWRASCMMGRVSLEVVRELTNALHSKMQRLPLTYFDRQQTGHLMARITSDVGSLMLFLKGSSLSLVSDSIL